MMRTLQEIEADLAGFAVPNCPNCNHRAILDDHGFYCERCDEDIANGAEFDAVIAELRAVLYRGE